MKGRGEGRQEICGLGRSQEYPFPPLPDTRTVPQALPSPAGKRLSAVPRSSGNNATPSQLEGPSTPLSPQSGVPEPLPLFLVLKVLHGPWASYCPPGLLLSPFTHTLGEHQPRQPRVARQPPHSLPMAPISAKGPLGRPQPKDFSPPLPRATPKLFFRAMVVWARKEGGEGMRRTRGLQRGLFH